jgi:hypothetical protein
MYGDFDAESMVRKYILNRFPKEGLDLLDEMARQKTLRKAEESEDDQISPPRKKTRLFYPYEPSLSSSPFSTEPQFSCPQTMWRQSSNLANDDEISIDGRANPQNFISPAPGLPTTTLLATSTGYLDFNRSLDISSPAANSDTGEHFGDSLSSQ